jgi:hypothetical protein
MLKMSAARVSEPETMQDTGKTVPWLQEGHSENKPHHVFGDEESMPHHGVWEGVWGWLNGRQETAAKAFRSPHTVAQLASTLATSSNEVDCVDAGHSLGLVVHAHGDGADAALAALSESFQSPRERSRRAAMHGLTAAGDAAVPFLLSQITFGQVCLQMQNTFMHLHLFGFCQTGAITQVNRG